VKRSVFAGLLLLTLFLFGSLTRLPAAAQEPAGTPSPAPTAPPASSASPDDILAAANKASEDANQAVNLVNAMLSFIQVAGVIGTILAALSAAAFGYTGLRTISEYRGELAKARAELDEMRARLEAETAEVRGQGNRAIRALSLMQLGEQQLESRNIKAALRVYREAYDLDPENRAINYFLGELYIQDREIEKGIHHLELALSGGEDYAPAEAALAYALRLQGDRAKEPSERNLRYSEAENRFLKALKSDPAVRDINGESVYGVLGGLYKRQNRIADAIRCYEEAARITPQSTYPVVNLAMLLFMDGRLDEAKEYFRRSAAMSSRLLDANPADYWTRLDLTTAQLVLGQVDEAKRNLTSATGQLQSASPLEIFLGDLYRLRDAPQPPPDIDQIIDTVQQAINRIRTTA
jgi:tetratricopeptide (TPR) repeat protein